MDKNIEQYLDLSFQMAEKYLSSLGHDLLQEMVATFEKQLYEELRRQSSLQLGNHLALPAQPDLSQVIQDHIVFTWSLGYAIGASTKTSGLLK
jgi:hypothetical protein